MRQLSQRHEDELRGNLSFEINEQNPDYELMSFSNFCDFYEKPDRRFKGGPFFHDFVYPQNGFFHRF